MYLMVGTGRVAYQTSVSLLRDRVPSFDKYPFSIPAIRNMASLQLHPRVTFLVGENGSGKSTLLEGIAVAAGFNSEGGGRNFRFATRDSTSELHGYLRLSRSHRRPRTGYFLRAESFFNVATRIEDLDREPALAPRVIESYGGRSLHEQSHGESFLALIKNRFGAGGLYMLDEPEAALSPANQLAFLRGIHDSVTSGQSQFLIASHSPIILAYPDATIYVLSIDGISSVPYEDT